MDQKKISIALMTLGTVLIVTALALLGVYWNEVRGDGYSGPGTVAGFGSIPTPGPTATPVPNLPPPSSAPVARIVIPNAEINAPVIEMGVDGNGIMESPDNAYDVAWYDFSARPGWGGNAVFAGHVDYIRVGPAVFWNIKDLAQGDVIEVHLTDGTSYQYGVTSLTPYDAATAPVDLIVGPTPKESVTLITCGGTFNSATHQYDQRLVVRAERIDQPQGLPPGT